MGFKVALVGIYHESNTFVESRTTVADFRNSHLLYGEYIREEYRDAHHEIGGMIEVMEKADVELYPLFFAEATPGGMVSAEAFEFLVDELLSSFRHVGAIDACLVVPHGAAVSEMASDMDGEWLYRLRELLGPNVSIVGTLDLHANVSERMIANTDALVVYTENPHLDQRERGKEAAMILLNTLTGRYKPFQKLIQVPVAISIEQQFTGLEPCKSLYRFAKKKERSAGVISISIALGFPYADVNEMGTAVIVVTNDDCVKANAVAQQILAYIMGRKERFVGVKNDIVSSLQKAERAAKPVLLLDMGDNIGGGATGNGIALLEALQAEDTLKFFMCVYDPLAVMAIERLDGSCGDIEMNGFNEHGNLRKKITVTPLSISNGKFRENRPQHGGQVSFDMGKMALAKIGSGVLMFTSLRIPPFSLSQLTSFGVFPAHFDVIVAKGVNAPIAAYGGVCRSVIQVDTPGVTRADMTKFHYENRRMPLFPFEDINR